MMSGAPLAENGRRPAQVAAAIMGVCFSHERPRSGRRAVGRSPPQEIVVACSVPMQDGLQQSQPSVSLPKVLRVDRLRHAQSAIARHGKEMKMSTEPTIIGDSTEGARAGGIERRDFVKRLAALGLAAPAIGSLSAEFSAPAAAAGMFDSDPTTLLIATAETPPGLDTEYNGSRSSHEGIAQTMDALVQFDKKLGTDGLLYSDFSNLKGALAESWDLAPDGKGVTFHLRKGVMSHWGNELTADDIFYSWNRGYQLKSNRAFYYFFMKMKDPSAITPIDKYTVHFKYDAPSSIAVVMHSNLYLAINDSKACKANSTASDPWARNWVAQNGAGFGPYYVDTWQPGQQVIFKAHEGYWRGAPSIKKVIVREVPNSANRLALIQTGAVDVSQWLLPNELAQVARNKKVQLANFRSNFQVIYSLNTKKPPYDNPKVREAFKWAFPYEDTLKTVFMGMAEPCKSIVPSVFPDSNETFYPYTTDLAKAKQLLTEAGFPDGFKTNLTYNTEISWDEELAILTQTNLKKIGVEATLNKVPGGPYFDQEWGKQLTTYFFEDQPNVPAAEYALWAFSNSKSRGDHTSYSNPELDALTNDALAELDPGKRQQMNYQAQKLLCTDGPYVFIARPPYSLAMNPGVKGARWFPAEHIRWDELTKS
jgi:peptide/nickel transport system substrate-binding protein